MKLLCCVLLFFFASCLAQQKPFQISVENISPGSSLPTDFVDLVWTVSSYANPLFHVGTRASRGLQSLAEDGVGQALLRELKNPTYDNGVVSSGLVHGPLVAGDRWDFGIFAAPGQTFSFITDLAQTNDNFVGPSYTGIPLFTADGDPITGTAEIYLYDAGTEVSETPGAGPNQQARQPSLGAGIRSNGSVTVVSSGNGYPSAASLIRVTITAATTFRFRLENTAKDTGLSPPVWAVSTSRNSIFTAGQLASPGLTQVAQNGIPSVLNSELAAKKGVVFHGIGASKAIPPGGWTEFDVYATSETLFSFVTMYGASNDRFFGTPDSGVKLFGPNGPLSSSKVSTINLWDSGTALNEQPGRGATQASARHNNQTVLNEFGVIKNSLADLDGFYYTSPSEAISLSVSGFGLTAAQSSFSASNPNQNVYVNFKFSNMFKLSH